MKPSIAMDRIDNIGSRIIVDWNHQSYKAASLEHNDLESLEEMLDSMVPRFHSISWFAIKNLLSRPWFERLWVWQEVTLPKNEVSVLCGHSEVPYDHFCNAVFYLYQYRLSLNMEVLDLARDVVSFSSRKSKDDLYELIAATRGCKCSDQRDKIFGMLGLTYDQVDIVANYSKPVREVFQDLVIGSLVKKRRLDILTLCSIQDSPLAFPTWANYSVPSASMRSPLQRAHAATDARAFFAGSSVLVATGICVAKVDQIEHMDSLQRTVNSHTTEEWEIARDLGNLATAIIGLEDPRIVEPKIESLCRAICCGVFSYKYLDPGQEQYYPDFRKSVQYASQCWAWSKGGCSSEDRTILSPDRWHPQFLRKAAEYISGRSVIKISNGLVGIAPEATQKEDVICVLLGCSSPLILRRKAAGHYAIVGECYIDEIVTGETFLGQLPEGWRIGLRWFPQYGGYYRSFHNSHSGISQREDPRLGSLPAGWRHKSHHYQDAGHIYVNDETGEDLGELHPNLRYEVLKARGIEFEDFRLI